MEVMERISTPVIELTADDLSLELARLTSLAGTPAGLTAEQQVRLAEVATLYRERLGQLFVHYFDLRDQYMTESDALNGMLDAGQVA